MLRPTTQPQCCSYLMGHLSQQRSCQCCIAAGPWLPNTSIDPAPLAQQPSASLMQSCMGSWVSPQQPAMQPCLCWIPASAKILPPGAESALLKQSVMHNFGRWRSAMRAGCHAQAGPVVTFLGTGCAEPSRYRGPSAIWVQLPTGASPLQLFTSQLSCC